MFREQGRCALFAAGVAAAAVVAWPASATQADPDERAQVKRGGELYALHCAACHGARLEGQPDWRRRKPDGRLPAPPHDETGHTWHHPDAILFAITRDGFAAHAPDGYETDMPGFGDALSDNDIRAVLAFIKSHWPEHIRARRRAAAVRMEKEPRQ
ncbi:MAG: cytochrome C [Rhizobiales bacterium NRL2]|jgi:mono/diheme cytochrome c family protein|nr:MAG: cytochrome C [Rhizobiales bacterium NRL2]